MQTNKYVLCIVVMFMAIATLNRVHAATMFIANLDGAQVAPPLGPSPSLLSGSATLTLDESTPADPKLAYSLQITGLNLGADPLNPIDDNDVTAIHIHVGAPGTNGPHALNVFGLSGGTIRVDDLDASVNSSISTVSGIWDNDDEMFTGPGGTKQPFDSFGLSDSLASLQAGTLYFQVHTKGFPDGELRGQIVAAPDQAPVPEPSTMVLLGAGIVSLFLIRKRF